MKKESTEAVGRSAKLVHIQNRENKPGEYYITRHAREIILEIKLRNSIERTGRIGTEAQRQEMLRHMAAEMAIAKEQGRPADVDWFENQCDKIRRKKLYRPRRSK